MEKDNLIVNLTFQFALDIMVCTELLENNKKFNLADDIISILRVLGKIISSSKN